MVALRAASLCCCRLRCCSSLAFRSFSCFAFASSRSPQALTPASVRAKQAVAALNFALILLDACWEHNLIEWLLAFTVMGFHLTFAMDLRGSVLTMQQPSAGEPLLHS